MEVILKLKPSENTKDLNSILGATHYIAKFLPKLSEQTDQLKTLLKGIRHGNGGPEQETDFNRIKQMLTKGPCLAHHAKEKDNIVKRRALSTGIFSATLLLQKCMAKERIEPTTYWLGNTKKIQAPSRVRTHDLLAGKAKIEVHFTR